jgi:hypothetical protein
MYCSTQSIKITGSELNKIREESTENNTRDGITGMLAYSNGYFLQTIEGSAQAINACFARIQKDVRHADVFILLYSPIVTRMFPSFEMRVVTENEVTRKVFFKYSSGASFNPYEFEPQAAELLLGELIDTPE